MAAKTIRFSQVVAKAGHPEPYTLWAKPSQDKVFTSLLKHNRVMTVHQETAGSKADYGEVGYTHDLHSSLLVFPKSLERFEGKRIIGIKYDELKEEPSAKTKAKPAKPSKNATLPKKEVRAPGSKKERAVPTPETRKEQPALASPANEIPFPRQGIAKPGEAAEEPEPKKAEDPEKELARLRKEVGRALDALSKDKPVTAYNVLKAAVGNS